MAPTHSLICVLSFILACWTPLVLGAPWIVTDHFQQIEEVGYGYDYSRDARTYITRTTYEEIIPTATSLPEAISTNVIVATDQYYDESVTKVNILYPSGVAGTPVPLTQYDGYNYGSSADYTTTVWVVNLTFSAPTGCSTQWTTTTAVQVKPPTNVAMTFVPLLPTTAASTSYSVVNDGAFKSSTYVYQYIWVDPTQVPSASLASLSDLYHPISKYGTADRACVYEGSNSGSYESPYDPSFGYGYSWGYERSLLAIALITLFAWVGFFFICGIIEQWFRFRRLMNGWQTRRGIPFCWVLTLIPLTCLCLFCFRRGYRARNAHDAAVLQKRWKALSAWKKFTLFLKWGFRYKYPTILGPAPQRVIPSKRPGKHPGELAGPPLLDSTASQDDVNAPVSPARSLNQRAASDASGPEMSQAHASDSRTVTGAAAPLQVSESLEHGHGAEQQLVPPPTETLPHHRENDPR
ncbi:hypothetical protein PDE_01434 [Penicillium oxalicum 114-2]|uniref:Uncharacterized protein n=1 Tax=Penicillium oxalicum (strain 114-2 / CGMCC 5302) TaxID=933388 RepID=S8AX50_PENO1|nr:hypothetical protein PDE_01434 [Penicillium oxalicum 114-2]